MRQKKSKVAVIKTSPKTVLQDYDKLLQMADYNKVLPKNNPLIVKLNLSWTLYFPSCSTQPWQLEGVLKKLKTDGYKKIIPVENKTVVTEPWQGAKLNKWLPIIGKYGLKYQPLTEVEWVQYTPKQEMFALDKIFKNGIKIPKLFLNKSIVHLPTMKTHGHTTTTGAMKNAFGGLITAKRHHCHKMIHEVIVDLLKIQQEIHPAVFAVMDGTVAGDGAGPRTMIPKETNYILASEDQVAIDAVAAKMMGFDPLKIKYLRLAHDCSLGNADVDQIEIVGDDVSNVNLGFSTGRSPVIFFDQMLRNKFGIIERLLFHTPLFRLCIFGSEFYHDWIWYPLTGRQRIKRFERTPWGKLFKEYK